MLPHLLVLPSPFLGSVPYERLVTALSALGYDASVAGSPASPMARDLLTTWSALARDRGDVVLVPHSNAGYLAPAVSEASGGAPVVFVDAALPDAEGDTRLAPSEFRSHLASLVGPDGRLPRWTRWWSREDVAATLPDQWFDAVDAAVPEVPLAYVDDVVPVPAGWSVGGCAYLAFGTTYAAEWTRAGDHRWPRRRLEAAGHLHLLVEPDQTATAVVDLAVQLRTS